MEHQSQVPRGAPEQQPQGRRGYRGLQEALDGQEPQELWGEPDPPGPWEQQGQQVTWVLQVQLGTAMSTQSPSLARSGFRWGH